MSRGVRAARLALAAAAALVGAPVPIAAEPLAPPSDPHFLGRQAWGQEHEDQWAIRRVGLTDGPDSAWRLVDRSAAPVVVALVDTGVDWHHLDLDAGNLWRNPGETPGNLVDDDRNGYVDDVIGWNFVENHEKPWDHDGHGTLVAGIVAATWNNGAGIAGVSPFARIMVLKALNGFGHTRASSLARAIVYAADNGARVINLSVGGEGPTEVERSAIEYADGKGALVVVAAGNGGRDVSGWGPAGRGAVLTVASTDLEDRRARFSNWGRGVDLAAPGVDVLGLRARRTDTQRDLPGSTYQPGSATVGGDRRYYRANGTSFSAPIVTGVASLLIAKNPGLTSQEVKRILLHSARDVETPGVDQYTGYGLLDARAALAADPRYFVEAEISSVRVVATAIEVTGSAGADEFDSARVEIGTGDAPNEWKVVIEGIGAPVRHGALGAFPTSELQGARVWMLRLVVRHRNGSTREARFRLNVG